MSKQTIIITGASQGIGAAAAFIASELGANVVLNARSTDLLAEHVDHIRNAGGNAIAIPGDISQAEDCQALVDKTMAHFGRIDSLVNNAGTNRPITPIRRAKPADLQYNLAVNLLGPMILTQAALPQLRLHHGRVINVSGGAAINAITGWAAYCAAKAGLNHFNRVLSMEEENVTALAFRPGVVDTPGQAFIRAEGAAGMSPEGHAQFVHYYQSGQLLPPEVPGGALAFLALYASPEWSGQLLTWDDPRIEQLRLQYGAGH